MELAQSGPSAAHCLHCGLAFRGNGSFCCGGCETVYGLLHEKGWSEFYSIRSSSPEIAPKRPVRASGADFSHLADLEDTSLKFFLEGIHCLSCLWLLERLPELLPGIQSAKLNLGTSVLSVTIDKGRISFADVADLIDRLGYPPEPLMADDDEPRKKENHRLLMRIGVAAVCAGNIMLLALSQYGGLVGAGSRAFSLLSFVLFLPVLFFSATPFFSASLQSIRNRRISIDVPVVLALLAGTTLSIINLGRGRDHMYFDSLSMLVFLLLSSRYLLRRMQEAQFQVAPLLSYLRPDKVTRVLASGKTESVSLKAIVIGDRLLVEPGEKIPADGILDTAETHVDMALLTGESAPVRQLQGDLLLAGTTNLTNEVILRITALQENTRLGGILERVQNESRMRTPLVEFSDKAARLFTYAVSTAALAVFLWFLGSNPEEGARRALALVIVACPCVLAFAIPFAGTLTLRRLSTLGIFVKNPAAIEAMFQVKNVAFDKTGTLTEGNFRVKRWLSVADDETITKAAVYSLELKSRHPVAKALVRFLSHVKNPLPISDFREVHGSGVSGRIGGAHYEVKKLALETSDTNVGVYRDGTLLARIALGDTIRKEANEVIHWIHAAGLKTSLLSGDSQAATADAAKDAGIENAEGNLLPEDKAENVKTKTHTLMVGDGANDAIALAAATVGVATEGSMEASLKSSDVYLARRGLYPLIDLFSASTTYRKVVWRNLLFSGAYNIAGATLALTGHIHPLTAAILMPLSSATVFFATLFQFRGARK